VQLQGDVVLDVTHTVIVFDLFVYGFVYVPLTMWCVSHIFV